MLSLNHLCQRAWGLEYEVTLYLKAEATQQGCDTQGPEWLCLSAQPDMCSAGRVMWHQG
ncbi:hypothetical protein Nmel_012281 [Mimus melanotis]